MSSFLEEAQRHINILKEFGVNHGSLYVAQAQISLGQAEVNALKAHNSHQLLDLPPQKREICQGCTLPKDVELLQAEKEQFRLILQIIANTTSGEGLKDLPMLVKEALKGK